MLQGLDLSFFFFSLVKAHLLSAHLLKLGCGYCPCGSGFQGAHLGARRAGDAQHPEQSKPPPKGRAAPEPPGGLWRTAGLCGALGEQLGWGCWRHRGKSSTWGCRSTGDAVFQPWCVEQPFGAETKQNLRCFNVLLRSCLRSLAESEESPWNRRLSPNRRLLVFTRTSHFCCSVYFR